jgi:SAM-dependent methyltransferase
MPVNRAFLRRHLVPLARRLPSSVQEPLRELWRAFAPAPAKAAQLDADAYSACIDNETAIFDAQSDVHDLPPIYHYWSNRYLRPRLETFGFSNPDEFFIDGLARACAKAQPRTARCVSIGAGNGDTEVRIARALIDRGCTDFTIDCLELNAQMLARGGALAREAGVAAQIVPLQGDFNAWRPARAYDAVIANQSLHHVVALENLFDAIAAALQPGGVFLAADIIGRNGHQRWPEALALVREFWRELPPAYRYNLQLQRREKMFRDWDCARESFEGIRAQDVLPLLLERFAFDFFYAFANVIDPFIDRSFGPHFDADSAEDRAFIDRVHTRDEAEILAGTIKPTHMFAAMRRKGDPGEATKVWAHLTPAFCVRDPRSAPLPRS